MSKTEDLRNVLVKILRAAQDGQSGSCTYGMDRLYLIEKLASAGLIKIDRPKPASRRGSGLVETSK